VCRVNTEVRLVGFHPLPKNCLDFNLEVRKKQWGFQSKATLNLKATVDANSEHSKDLKSV